ncbi:MAG: RNA polymerase sigma factor [Nitrospirota bacterium]
MEDGDLRAHLERLHPDSVGWARACCARDALEAETVLQTAYVKILDHRARFDGRASFKTWVFAVIRKTALDERRRALVRRFWSAAQAGAAAPPIYASDADRAVYCDELRGLFRRALAELPSRQREALHLVFYHEMSLQEAAEVMGVSIGAVRQHYDRGKKRLRCWMELHEVDHD